MRGRDEAGTSELDFLSGGGTMGELMRADDWSVSPLGPPETWPQSLRSVVSLLLSSKFPMFVAWGPELGFLYNDPYAEILGAKHPQALGRRFKDIWSEIWPDISPLIDAALAGEATYRENLPLTMNRKGFDEQTWFTFSYSPVRDESGHVAGMYCACSETTGQVLAERRLTEERERQRKLFEQAPGFITILSGPELRFEFVNEAYDRLFGRRGFVGKTVREAFPDLEGQPFFGLLENAYATGERFIAHATPIRLQASPDVPPTDRFLDFIYEPVRDEGGAVTGLFIEGHDVTERVRAEQRRDALLKLDDRLRDVADTADLSFAASQLLGEALGAARVGYGAFDPDATTLSIERDWRAPGFSSVAGVHRFENYGSHGEDLRRGLPVVNVDVETDPRTRQNPGPVRSLGVAAFLDVPIVEGGRTVAQMFVHSDRPRAWTDHDVDFVRDVAERTRAAIARRLAEQALIEAEHRLKEAVNAAGLSADFRALFEASPTPFLVVAPPDWTIVAANDARLRVTGMSREGQLGRKLFDVFPDDPDDPTADGVRNLAASLERVVASRASDVMAIQRYAVREADGRFVERWWSPVNSPVLDRNGDVALIIHRVEDVTETVRLRGEAEARDQLARDQQTVIDRMRASEAALRESEARFRLMADAVPQIVWITDRQGRMEFLNKQFVDYTGASAEAWPHAELGARFMHPDDGAKVAAAFEVALGTGESFEVEHRIRSAAGEYRWFLARAEPYRDPGTGEIARWFGASIDIHDRKLAEAALRESDARNRFRVELGDAMRGLTTPSEIMAVVADRLGAFLGVDQANYYRIDGDCFTVSEEWRSDRSAGLIGSHRIADFGPDAKRLMDLKEMLRRDDTRGADGSEGYSAAGMVAVLSAPLHSGGQWAGGFHVHSAEPRAWTDEEAALVRETAERAWAEMERARAEAELRESEARYRTLFEAIDAGFCIFDMIFNEEGRATDFRFVEVNPAFERQTGVGGVVGRRMREIAPDLEEVWFERYGRVALTGEQLRVEDEAAALGRWFDINAFRVGAPEQRRVAALFNDVTARRKIEAELRESELRLRDLNADLERQVVERARERGRTWEVSPDLLCVFENDGRFSAVNPAWTATLGWTQDELVGALYTELLHPEDAEFTTKTLEALQRDLPVLGHANRYRTKDGGWRWLSWVAVPVDGRFYCSARDVTEEKAQAAELAVRTAERDQMWETSPDLMVIIDFKGVFRRLNPAWTKVLGYDPQELIGHHVNEFVVPEDHDETTDAYELAASGGRPTIVNRYRHMDGSIRWISWTAAPAGDLTYATGRDITLEKEREAELKAAQEALRQSQKMEAMGQLTGGVAHDFNNLLTPIVGSLDMLQRKGLGGDREKRLIAGAMQSAERAKVLVQRLLAFARRQPLQPAAIDVARLVTGMADLVSSTTGPQIKIVVEAPADLPLAQADANQLEMALLNLAVNARDAMPDGGTLRISATPETVSAGQVTGLPPGAYVKMSVADTGVGMNEATLARAIEPFFSTKGIGKGTGLGLSMVHGLASQLGGALRIKSRPGLGTNIELWLPQTVAAPEADTTPAEVVPTPIARGTALLVDDEEIVRMSTADMLDDLGYEVVEAGSAEEALGLVERGLRPDVLVTDHLMPGMSGTDLARMLQARSPGLSVLIVSGYAESDGIAPDLTRLTKPFRNDELAASLASLAG